MLSSYLLDTNILSELVRNPDGIIQKKIAILLRKSHRVCTSILVAAESRYGILKKESPRLAEQVEQVLAAIDILPFDKDGDLYYARLRLDLERRGQLIGGTDMFIAAHALATRSILVTHNVREFSRISELVVEDWLV